MPKNKVSDPITDQEIAFARLVLSGTMTDRHAAEAVGLSPDSAAYTKAKPRVRAYMREHRAAVQQQLVQQEAEGLRRLNLDREQVLNRLWEIAKLSPEMTRGSVTGQVKALSMIVAMENFIPNRIATSSEKKSPPAINHRGSTAPNFVIPPSPGCRGSGADGPAVPLNPQPSRAPNQSTFANRSTPSEAPKPHVPLFASAPDLGVPFSIKKNPVNPFVRPR